MPPPVDLKGQHFGLLTVRKLSKKRDRHGRRLWHCKCDCGRRALVSTGQLRSGLTTSCGCRRIKKPYDLAGRRFGRLTAVKLLRKRDKHGKRLWRCQCSCGRPATVSANQLAQGKTKSCGCISRERRKEAKDRRSKIKWATDGGEEWCTAGPAARYLGVHVSTLYPSTDGRRPGWIAFCPLSGRGIETRRLPTHLGRDSVHLKKADLDSIKAALARMPSIPAVPGKIHIAEACAQRGCSIRTLRRRMQGAGQAVTKHLGKGADGRPRWRAFVPAADDGEPNDEGGARRPGPGPDPDTERKPSGRRGRPRGRSDATAEKYQRIRDAWNADPSRQTFPTVMALAAHFHVSRSLADAIIHGRV